MYDIKNLTNEVQYLCFKSGKECFLAGKDSVSGIRDSEITSVMKKMSERKIISLVEVKAERKKPVEKAELSTGQATGDVEKDKGRTAGKGRK